MKCLLLYDIPDDKIRGKIATFCWITGWIGFNTAPFWGT